MNLAFRVLVAAVAALSFGDNAPVMAADCNPLTMITSVDLAHRDGDPRMFVPVSLEGKPKLMLLDTGGGVSEITAQTANELGLQRRTLGFMSVDLAGETSDQAADVMSFSIGQLTTKSIEFVVSPESQLFRGDSRYAGVIGPNILRQYDVDIDFGVPKLAFLSPDHCEGKVIYWPASAVAVVPIRITKPSDHIAVTVKLDGKNVLAILDTGASMTTLTYPVAESDFGLKMGSPDTPYVGEMPDKPGAAVYKHRFKSLDFDGIAVGNLDVEVIPDFLKDKYSAKPELGTRLGDPSANDEFPDMLIGMNVLKHLHVYIAYNERKLYITPAGAPAMATSGATDNGTPVATH